MTKDWEKIHVSKGQKKEFVIAGFLKLMLSEKGGLRSMVWKKIVESSVKLKRMLGHRGQDAGTRGRNRQMFPNTRSLAEGTVRLGPKLQRRGQFWTLVPPEFLGEL